jgi:hypothetical protein
MTVVVKGLSQLLLSTQASAGSTHCPLPDSISHTGGMCTLVDTTAMGGLLLLLLLSA